MKNLTSNEIRQIWLSFWEAKQHLIVPSANLIPVNDKSVLWINAGVTPLKKFFDGSSIPENKRLVNAQKCIRTGDIESVGDATHLTFFEMLGNFSIGNYFKEEAITWGYELLTSEKYYNFPKEKLYFTVHPSDRESKELWSKLGVPSDHIIELAGNFWEIGEGPCGPCSEIFYDRGEAYDPNKEGILLLKDDIENSRYVEIWNIVFSSFNAVEGVPREDYKDLPSKNIDTGMGLERMTLVMQEVPSIYETDLFKNTIHNIELITNTKYTDEPGFRIIADHIRTITMALKDGASFGNSGRGYVIRRLLRRAVREGYKMGTDKAFLYRLVPIVASTMQDFYPFNGDQTKNIMDSVMNEELLFHKTLAKGEERIKQLIDVEKVKDITGVEAFKLYDTYGFPLELTLEIAREAGISVDTTGFMELMEVQRKQSQAGSNMENNMSLQNPDLIACKLPSTFVGYDNYHVDTKVIALFDRDGTRVQDLYSEGYIILDRTPFYAESGGQTYDTGFMRTEKYKDNDKLIVEKVIKAPNGQHLHLVKMIQGVISQDEPIEAKIDHERREKIAINHSAAHLLHHALKEILSKQVYQAGSFIDDERLRFDFNFVGEVTDELIIKIEKKVNQLIEDSVVSIAEMPLEEAKERGATALFDDKYGNYVRTVRMGDSFELCGGTHVANIKEINKLAVLSCESKGANVFRIEATTGKNINILLHDQVKPYKEEIHKLLIKASDILHHASAKDIHLDFNDNFNLSFLSSYADVVAYKFALADLQTGVKDLEKEYLKRHKANLLADLSFYEKYIVNDVLIITVQDQPVDVLKEIVDKLAHEKSLAFVFVANINHGNVNFLCRVDNKKYPRLNAGDIVKSAASQVGGNGGGSPSFAQGGGTNTALVNDVLDNIRKIYNEMGD